MVKLGEGINEEQLKNVTGGTGIIGMDNFESLLKKCPKCGGIKISKKTFIADDGKTSVPGQLCSCGYSWTYEDGGTN
ncbi:MAG: hypothetical protein IJR59_04065 [Firmicutes bacterium]|nr:hypothetical protein [Bacillota bacterium]